MAFTASAVKTFGWREQSRILLNTEFADPEVPFGYQAPYRDPEHKPKTCLVCAAGPIQNGMGTWRLRVPINIPRLMPGTNRTITSLKVSGSSQWTSGTVVAYAYSNIALVVDGTEIFRANNLSHNPLPGYALNEFRDLNINVDDGTELDVVLEQKVVLWIGWAAHHDFDITIGYGYYSLEPIETGDVEVRVYDSETRTPISGINVRLMAGTRVIRDGTTDGDGVIRWEDVEEGDYTLKAFGRPASYFWGGYLDNEVPVTVRSDVLNSFQMDLTPIEPIPIPWYVWAGAGTVALLGAYLIFRPRIPSPVIVVGERIKEAIRR